MANEPTANRAVYMIAALRNRVQELEKGSGVLVIDGGDPAGASNPLIIIDAGAP